VLPVMRLLHSALLVAAVPASQAARLGGTPVALVTAEAQNQLLVVDLSTGHVIQRLRMPTDPQNVETTPTNDAGAVVSTRGGAVTLLALPRLRVRRTLTGFRTPHIAAFAPKGRYLYVTDDARGQLVTIGVRRARVASRSFVGFGAHHMAFRPDRSSISVFDVRVVSTRASRQADSLHDLAFTPDGRRDRLRPLAEDYPEFRTIPAGQPPQHVAFGRYAYVTSGNDGQLRVFSRSGRLLGVARTPVGSFNLGLGWGVVTPSLTQGTLTQLRVSGSRVWTRCVASAARDAAVAILP
jgi:DNA-binding beta-propeller fold protein YncE